MKGSNVFIRAIVAVLFLTLPALAREAETADGVRGGQSLAKAALAMGPVEAGITINNYLIFIDRDAESPLISSSGVGADYPKGTAGMIFQEGLVWGARVRDGETPVIRVNGSTYETGVKAGRVLYDDDGNVIGSEDRTERHIWRVRKDYLTADLKSDFAYSENVDLGAVTSADEAELRAQYAYDWANWPAVEGAPYKDVDGDGAYDPTEDQPGWPGADQTIWLVANDLPYVDPETGETVEVSLLSYGSPAIGMEIQITMWGYAFAAEHPLGNAVFRRVRMIYTGLPTTPDTAWLDSLYFSQWSDPDLGEAGDDYVGCDIDLSLGYVYNGSADDADFLGGFGIPTPSGGYDFLQGPIVDGDTLGMTSFGYFGAGSAISDPNMGTYGHGTLGWFNLMEGFLPQPQYPTQTPWTDPTTGETTVYPLSGDPVTGTGWIDGISLPPGDRRLLLTTGPFSMALGDTQDVVIASVAGIGQDNISSVTVMKFHDTFAQYAYDNDFDLPSPPATPLVATSGFDNEVVLNWGNNLNAVAATEKTVSKGFVFEGYNVYQLPEATSASSEWVKVATYDKINLIQTIFDKGIDPASGFIVDQAKQAGTNSGIQRYHRATRDEVRDKPITNDNPLYFVVTAYSYLADNVGRPFKTLESSPALVTVIPQMPFAGTVYAEDPGASMAATHSVGTAGGTVSIDVVNPADLTGESYEVYFDQQHYYMDFWGWWQRTNYPDSVGKALGKGMDLTGTSLSAIAYTSPIAGTRDLKFILDLQAPDYDYSDGLSLTFSPAITINSAEVAVGNAYGTSFTPVIDEIANTVTWGAADTTEDGDFAGNEVFTVNVATPTLPLDVDYIVWDDGWALGYGAPYDTLGDGVVHAVGTCTISTEAYAFKTEKHWNLRNVTKGDTLLEDQTNIVGVDLYSGELYGDYDIPIFDGFQLTVNVGYAAPNDFNTYTHIRTDGSTDVFSMARADAWLNYDQAGKPYIITSYMNHGWGETARAVDTWGAGSSELELLQADYELRFTGEYDAPETVGNLTLHRVKDGTGSIATHVGARGYAPADHPMVADVSTDISADGYFAIRIPFEVWNTDTGEQIDILIYDRMQGDPADGGDFYAFNPSDRMYCYVLNRPYSETIAAVEDGGADEEYLTWNLIFWNTDGEVGDVVMFNYDNPIVLGHDLFTFATEAPTSGDDALAKESFKDVNVFPNPYYGFHLLENHRTEKWMKFNHLPQKVTIRIFTLGGVMVRVLDKDDNTQYIQWDLQNQGGFPVASGIYIAHVEAWELGVSKILKLAIVQEEQILTKY